MKADLLLAILLYLTALMFFFALLVRLRLKAEPHDKKKIKVEREELEKAICDLEKRIENIDIIMHERMKRDDKTMD